MFVQNKFITLQIHNLRFIYLLEHLFENIQ